MRRVAAWVVGSLLAFVGSVLLAGKAATTAEQSGWWQEIVCDRPFEVLWFLGILTVLNVAAFVQYLGGEARWAGVQGVASFLTAFMLGTLAIAATCGPPSGP